MKRSLTIFLAASVLAGCQPHQTASPLRSTSVVGGQSTREHLAAAMDYLEQADEFEEAQATTQVAYHLNRWLEGVEIPSDFRPDPLTVRLPREVRADPAVQNLGQPRIQLDDVKPLQQAVWLRQIAAWASQRPADAGFEQWCQGLPVEQGGGPAGQLVVAYRLFDWTVRNIQLDQLLPYPADVIAQPKPQPGEVSSPPLPPPQRGVPGPGYQFHPWQTLLYGRGDALQRARVFILLCRQMGTDVVMLAFPGKTTPPRPRPWLAAVLVGSDLYLFDTGLGTPIPGPNGSGAATLVQVLDDPSLLTALTVSEELRYEVELADLQNLQALVDAAADALSLRMHLIERQLMGEHRTVLTTSPTPLAERLGKCRGVADVTLWSLPYETTWYQQARLEQIRLDEASAARYFAEFGVFTMRSTLVQARTLHFRGAFDSQGEKKGAKALYMETRLPQAQLDSLLNSEETQQLLGMTQMKGERDVAWRSRLVSAQLLYSQAKLHATYWLGLAQFDTDRLDAAVEWLQRRTLEGNPDGPWTSGARYNLARSYERLGQFDEARRWYESDESSPQRQGNLLRARELRRAAAQTGDKPPDS